MRINEIITESQELEEGWKQKLAGAALAGAAMLGGGHATDASAQTTQAQTQAASSVPIIDVGHLTELSNWIGYFDTLQQSGVKIKNAAKLQEYKKIWAANMQNIKARYGDSNALNGAWKFYNMGKGGAAQEINQYKTPEGLAYHADNQMGTFVMFMEREVGINKKSQPQPKAQPQQQAQTFKLTKENVIDSIHAGKVSAQDAKTAQVLLNRLLVDSNSTNSRALFAQAELLVRHPGLDPEWKKRAIYNYNQAQKLSPGLPNEDKNLVKQVYDILSGK